MKELIVGLWPLWLIIIVLAVSLIINGIKVNHIDNNDLPDHGLSPKEKKAYKK
jgi:hypothetical protein